MDDAVALGGCGGEAGQPDGRGGRGARNPLIELGLADFQLPDGRWLSEAGRGGDGAHSPQYGARLMVIEEILDQLGVPHHRKGANTYCADAEALLTTLNERLKGRGWGVTVRDGLFSFYDTHSS